MLSWPEMIKTRRRDHSGRVKTKKRDRMPKQTITFYFC